MGGQLLGTRRSTWWQRPVAAQPPLHPPIHLLPQPPLHLRGSRVLPGCAGWLLLILLVLLFLLLQLLVLLAEGEAAGCRWDSRRAGGWGTLDSR